MHCHRYVVFLILPSSLPVQFPVAVATQDYALGDFSFEFCSTSCVPPLSYGEQLGGWIAVVKIQTIGV